MNRIISNSGPRLTSKKDSSEDERVSNQDASESTEVNNDQSIVKNSEESEEILTPLANITEDDDNTFNNPNHRIYSGPCSETNCTKVFDRVFRSAVRNHFRSDHQKEVSFVEICHICNKEIRVSPRSGNKAGITEFRAHMKIHDGDLDLIFRKADEINSCFLQTKCGLKLSRDFLVGK